MNWVRAFFNSGVIGGFRSLRKCASSSLLSRLTQSESATDKVTIFEASMLHRLLSESPVDAPPATLRRLTKLGVLAIVFLIFAARPYTIQRAVGVHIGGVHIYLVSVVLILTLAATLLFGYQTASVSVPKAVFPLFFFIGYFLIRALFSLQSTEPIEVAREMRHIPYYLLILSLLIAVQDRRDCRELVMAMSAGTAIAIGLFMLGQFGITLPGTVGRGWLTRQYVNEITFIPTLLFVVSYVTVLNRRTSQVLASELAFIVLGAIWLSGTRTLFIVLIGVIPLLFLGLAGRDSVDMGLWTLGSGVIGIAIFGILAATSPELQACLVGHCNVGGQITFQRSLGFRVQEWYYWTVLFFREPIFGMGLGIRYQDFFTETGRLVGGLRGSSTVFWGLAKLGLVGIALYVWSIVAGIRAFVWQWSQLDPEDFEGRALLIGSAASAVGILFEGMVHSNGLATISNIVILLVLFTIILRA